MTTQEANTRTAERGFVAAPEPGGRISAELGDDMPSGNMVMTKTPTYVYLWNRDTRERSVFAMHTARAKMNERFPYDHPRMAGDFAWQSDQPSEPAWKGIAICPLHPDRPERAEYDKLGYPVCDRVALPNEGDAQRHLQRKHKDTYELIEKAKEEAFQHETRDSNRSMNERLLALLEDRTIGPTIEDIPEVPEAEPEFWSFEQNDALSVATVETVLPQTLGVTDADPTTSVLIMVKNHAHRYGRAMGSSCKVGGCTAVRETRFQKKKKRK